jgi:hypothetical protein
MKPAPVAGFFYFIHAIVKGKKRVVIACYGLSVQYMEIDQCRFHITSAAGDLAGTVHTSDC